MQILADLEGKNASIVSLLVTEICTKKFLGCAQLLAVSLTFDFCCHRLEAHAGVFNLLMKGIFDPYVL